MSHFDRIELAEVEAMYALFALIDALCGPWGRMEQGQ